MELNSYVDHTLLSPNAMTVAFHDLVKAAAEHRLYAVCVSPHIAGHITSGIAQSLMDPEYDKWPHLQHLKVCTVVSFPHGNIPTPLKIDQAAYHISNGVDEIDWVLNVGDVYEENWRAIENEMQQMGDICRRSEVVSKCIVETGSVISETYLRKLFELVRGTGVDFIKTSTGFNGPGAQVKHIRLWNEMRAGAEYPKIKASGGIKTAEQAVALIEAGADRLGMSSSVEVMEQFNARPATFTEGETKIRKVY